MLGMPNCIQEWLVTTKPNAFGPEPVIIEDAAIRTTVFGLQQHDRFDLMSVLLLAYDADGFASGDPIRISRPSVVNCRILNLIAALGVSFQ